jgi:hypothetical protein
MHVQLCSEFTALVHVHHGITRTSHLTNFMSQRDFFSTVKVGSLKVRDNTM